MSEILSRPLFERLKWLRQVLTNRVAEVIVYKEHWGPEFSLSQLYETVERYAQHLGHIDLTELTAAEMCNLGFGKFSERSKSYLIPLWIYPWLPEEVLVYPISGDGEKGHPTIQKSSMDTDHRFGLLAYSVYPKDYQPEPPSDTVQPS